MTISDILLSLPRRVAFGLLERSSPRITVETVSVMDFTAAADSIAMLDRVRDALLLIQAVDRRRFSRLQVDLRRVVITHGKSAGEYVPAVRACLLDAGAVRQHPREYLASILVHEATHARVARAGIRYEGPNRERIERRCVREELAFLARGEGTEEMRDRISAHLADEWWRDDEARSRRTTQLRSLGVPLWILRLRQILWHAHRR